jgi:hypothetical protein
MRIDKPRHRVRQGFVLSFACLADGFYLTILNGYSSGGNRFCLNGNKIGRYR